MPNGECPVGAELRATIEGQEHQIGEMKVRQDRFDKVVNKLVVGSAVRDWKIGAIIAIIVVALNALVQIVVVAANGG